MEVEANETRRKGIERRTHMQQYTVQQERQTCVLPDNMQHFKQEISALRSLAEVAGVTDHLLAELDVFKHDVEHIDSSAWEQKEVRLMNRNELVRLSLSVLRAYGSRSG
jgi:hypothetical protein